MSTIHEKLINVQSALKAPKSQVNAFAKYKYRSCEDILEAVKPLLKEQGLMLLLSDSIELIGNWHYVKATAAVQDGESIASVSAYAREPEEKKGSDVSQITGAASSYARKYALNGLFCIDDTKDADSTNDHGKAPQKVKEEAPKGDPEAGELAKLKSEIFKFCGSDLEKVKEAAAKIGIKEPAQMKLAEAKRLFNNLLDTAA